MGVPEELCDVHLRKGVRKKNDALIREGVKRYLVKQIICKLIDSSGVVIVVAFGYNFFSVGNSIAFELLLKYR